MPYPLNNVQVTNDQYDDAHTAKFQLPVNSCFIIVANAAVYIQIERVEPGMRTGAGNFLPEEFKIPGAYQFRRDYTMGQVRVRRAVTTTTPSVTLT